MRLARIIAPLALAAALAGCISYTSSPPSHTTIAAPPGSTVVCSGSGQPPC